MCKLMHKFWLNRTNTIQLTLTSQICFEFSNALKYQNGITFIWWCGKRLFEFLHHLKITCQRVTKSRMENYENRTRNNRIAFFHYSILLPRNKLMFFIPQDISPTANWTQRPSIFQKSEFIIIASVFVVCFETVVRKSLIIVRKIPIFCHLTTLT